MDVTINSLNTDCLIDIFKKLELVDILKVEMVCVRWNEIAKLAWSQIKTLDFAEAVSNDECTKRRERRKKIEKKTDFITNILKARGTHFDTLVLSDELEDNINCYKFVDELAKHCKNITNLVIDDAFVYGTELFNDEFLEFLFSKIRNFNSISLMNVRSNAKCLLKLFADNIKKLLIGDCKIFQIGYFAKFLKSLKNLNEVKMYCLHGGSLQFEGGTILHINNMIDHLSECKNLTLVDFRITEPPYLVPKLPSFLAKQKELSTLTLYNVSISEGSIPDRHLLDNNFENLISFTYQMRKLVFDELQVFIKFLNINLKEINIIFGEVSKESNIDFKRLENLETFTIKKENDNATPDLDVSLEEKLSIDSILKELPKCKKLTTLMITDCIFSPKALSFIANLKSLVNLKITSEFSSYNLKEEYLKMLFENVLNLKNVTLENYFGVTRELLNDASKIKTKRGDKHLLKIITNYDIDCDSLPPLIFHCQLINI